MTPYSFRCGYVKNKTTAGVLAQIDELAEQDYEETRFLRWDGVTGKWGSADHDWVASRMWMRDNATLFIMGPRGHVLWAGPTGPVREDIDASGQGAQRSGDFLDLRQVGRFLYACGMSRQVYRRTDHGWVRADQGVVQPAGTFDVAGFTSLDGLDEHDFFAVGFAGEIWRCVRDRWIQIDSPTNVVLHSVRAVEVDQAYACGQQGLILRGRGDRWNPIDQSETDDELWSVEAFLGSIYFASETALYRLNPDDTLERLDTGLGEDWSYRQLHANDGVMWSFGTKHVAWTSDAVTWHDVTP